MNQSPPAASTAKTGSRQLVTISRRVSVSCGNCKKKQASDHSGRNRTRQYRTGGDILCHTGERMETGGNQVGQPFDSGVDRFQRNNQPNRKKKQPELCPIQPVNKRKGGHQYRRTQMEAHISLGYTDFQTVHCVQEAFEKGGRPCCRTLFIRFLHHPSHSWRLWAAPASS